VWQSAISTKQEPNAPIGYSTPYFAPTSTPSRFDENLNLMALRLKPVCRPRRRLMGCRPLPA